MMEKVRNQSDAAHMPRMIDAAIHDVNQLMLDVVASNVAPLKEASHHILEAGGKRVRPRLVLLSYALFDRDDFEKIIPVAAALELVHTASVVHDDINDHGVVRRGRPSVNSIWGRTFALLTGDFLFTKVYELMAPYKDMNIIFAEATVALVEGETLQASAVKEKNLTRQVYMEIIALKTAALFKAGGKLGASLADADDEAIEALGNFGYNIGLAFQIVDDILDVVGDETQTGKTTGLDQDQGKGFTSIENGNGSQDIMETVKGKLLENIDQAQAQAEQLVSIGIDALEIFPDSPAKQELIALAHSVVNRST